MDFLELLNHVPDCTKKHEHPQYDLFKKFVSRKYSLVRVRPLAKNADREENWQQFCDIGRSWEDLRLKKNENAGITVGVASNIIVIDVDDIVKTADWMQQNDINFDTRIHKTPKGWHVIYNTPLHMMKLPNKIVTLDIGFEIMINKFQIVCPGSVVKKDNQYYKYSVYNDVNPSDPPEWLVALLNERKGTQKSPKQYETGIIPQPLMKFLPPSNGERNTRLMEISGYIKHRGFPSSVVFSFIEEYGKRVGLPTDEISKCADSMARYYKKKTSDTMYYIKKNEIGDMELFCVFGKQHLIYDNANKRWMSFNGNYWKIDNNINVPIILDKLAEYYETEFDAIAEKNPQAGNLIQQRLTKINTKTRRNNIVALAQEKLNIKGNEWNPSNLIGTRDGVLDLGLEKDKVVFRQGEPKDYISKIIPVTLGWEHKAYSREDLSSIISAEWERFLLQLSSNNIEVAMYLNTIFGYALAGVSSEEVGFVFIGEKSGNGKTTLMSVLQNILGDYCGEIKQSYLQQFKNVGSPNTHDSARYSFFGKRIAYVEEISSTKPIDESSFKEITGGGFMSARPPYGSVPLSWQKTHTLFMLCNKLPPIKSEDEGVWRRIKFIKFDATFRENPKDGELKANKNLEQKLIDEAPGIIASLCYGILDYKQYKSLNHPLDIKEWTKEYRKKSNPTENFLNEQLSPSPRALTSMSDVYRAYKEWSLENGYKPKNKKNFVDTIASNNVSYLSTDKNYIKGYSLTENNLF